MQPYSRAAAQFIEAQLSSCELFADLGLTASTNEASESYTMAARRCYDAVVRFLPLISFTRVELEMRWHRLAEVRSKLIELDVARPQDETS